VALADALRRVLDDPGLAAALGAAGRARAADAFSMEAYRTGVLAAWRAAIGA
jgi:glycosyltransferase involved in cell wall biosynthesis